MARAVVTLLALWLTVGCRSETTGGAVASATASASASASVASGPLLRVEVDGVARVALSVSELTPPKKLQQVLPDLPADAWREVVARSDAGRELTLRKFAKRWPQHDIRLYASADGKPAVGVFQRVFTSMSDEQKKKLETPKATLLEASLLSVRTVEVARVEPNADKPLSVKYGEQSTTLSAAQLAALPREPARFAPDRQRDKKAGWPLVAVLSLAKASGDVKVVGGEGEEVRVPAAWLDDASRQVLLRRNRRGELSLDVWRQGQSAPSPRMRTVRAIVVEPITAR